MTLLIVVGVFVVVAVAVFVLFSLMDQRRARARLLRERLETADKPAERRPDDDLALVRDEMLSEIPAIDNLLRRSERISRLQTSLSQADLNIRAGNVLLICVVSAAALGAFVFLWSGFPQAFWLGVIFGAIIPYSYVSYRRSKRFQEFETLFPHATGLVTVVQGNPQTNDFDTMIVDVQKMPPNVKFTVFLTELSAKPFGHAEYVGDLITRGDGSGS